VATYEYQYGNNIGSYSLVVPSYQKYGAPFPPLCICKHEIKRKLKMFKIKKKKN